MGAELKVLPNNGMAASNRDIAKHLREQADWLEESDASEVRTCMITMEYTDGTLFRTSCGQPMDLARAMGLSIMAIIQKTTGILE
jgi:hypothetical protein